MVERVSDDDGALVLVLGLNLVVAGGGAELAGEFGPQARGGAFLVHGGGAAAAVAAGGPGATAGDGTDGKGRTRGSGVEVIVAFTAVFRRRQRG